MEKKKSLKPAPINQISFLVSLEMPQLSLLLEFWREIKSLFSSKKNSRANSKILSRNSVRSKTFYIRAKFAWATKIHSFHITYSSFKCTPLQAISIKKEEKKIFISPIACSKYVMVQLLFKVGLFLKNAEFLTVFLWFSRMSAHP